MFDLPWATHRYLLEPISGFVHMSKILVRRYLSFVEKLRHSNKPALRGLLAVAEKDVRTTTGGNLRKIMMMQGKARIEELSQVDIEYQGISEQNKLKLKLLEEVVDIRHEVLQIPGWDQEDIAAIIEYICTA